MDNCAKALAELEMDGIVPDNSGTTKESDFKLDTDSAIIDEMQRITGVEYSAEQKKVLKSRGNMVIMACAGSGKTTVLTHLITKRIWNREITDTSKMLCTTYSKAGAEEMEERLRSLLEQCGIKCHVEVKTLHAFYYMLLRTFGWGNVKTIKSETVRKSYIKEACKDAGYTCKDDDLETISTLLSYQVNNLLNDNNTMASSACTLEDMSLEQYKMIRKGYDLRKRKSGQIDFDDMQLYVYKWLCKDVKSANEEEAQTGRAVRDYCRAMWQDFYIDEAQDISKIQYEILKALVLNPETGVIDRGLVFMGDDDQSIYKWRGASPEIILTIGATMQLSTFVLGTNYRCMGNIVEFAANSIKYNNDRYVKEMSAKEAGGKVDIVQCISHDIYQMSLDARKIIQEKINSGVNPKDIAVLCRNNINLGVLGSMLIKDRIYCESPKDMKLSNCYMYKDIKKIIELCHDTYNGKVTQDIMWKLCTFMGVKTAMALGKFQADSGMSIKNVLGYLSREILGISGIELQHEPNIPVRALEKMRYILRGLNTEATQNLVKVYDILTMDKLEDRFNALTAMYMIATEFLYKNEDKARTISGIIAYIKSIIREKGFDEMENFLRTAEQLEGGAFSVGHSTVTLSTVHSAKGKEWEHVILFACDNITMPGLKNMAVSMDKGIEEEDIYSLIDEERRLYYVGCTRAKKELTIISNYRPSVFILESLGEYKEVTGTNNDTVYDMIINGDEPKILNESQKHIS